VVFGKTATLWMSKDVHEFQALVDVTNNDPCGTMIQKFVQCTCTEICPQDKFQYNVRGDNPENKSLTLYIVPEKDAELAHSMKLSNSP